MKRIPHSALADITAVVFHGLITNVLLVVSMFPLVFLLVATDPARSWLLIAAVAPFSAPALSAAFASFTTPTAGIRDSVQSFIGGWRATWRKALALGALATVAAVVLLVDVRFFTATPYAVVAVPFIGVALAITAAILLVSLVALSESPEARLRDLLRASTYLGVRRWYLTVVSLLVLAAHAALFTTHPAIALGLTAAPALYVTWANSRHILRPVMHVSRVSGS